MERKGTGGKREGRLLERVEEIGRERVIVRRENFF